MNVLLVFFAIPIATIILSGILETFIHCPFKVAGIFFSIFIVVAFALGGTAELLVAAIVYTIISFVTAYIVMIIQNRDNDDCRCSSNNSGCNENLVSNNNFSGFTPNTFTFNNETAAIPSTLTENDNFGINNSNNNMCRRFR